MVYEAVRAPIVCLLTDKPNYNMALDVDAVLKRIGQFGPFQIRILVMFLFIFFPITYQTLIMVFVAFEPPWMCNRQSAACLATEGNSSSSRSLVYSTATKPSTLYERRCTELKRTDWKFAEYNLYEGPHETIVNEFDLVCNRAFLAWLANAMLFFGWAIGAIVLGLVADKYGRKSVLFPSIIVVLVVSFAMAFAKVFWIVAVCRFIIGFFEAGCFLSMFVLATELVGPEKRALAGTLVWFYFTAALMVLGLKAYFVRNWSTLLILSSAPWVFILIFWRFVPESVRWLLVNGKKEQAREILERVAAVNKKEIPRDELQVPVTTANQGVLELFKTWKMSKMSLAQIYIWFGRKKTIIAHMVAAGIAVVAVSLIPHGTNNTGFIAGRVTLGTLGKMFITTSFNAVYIFSAELFPTVVRNSGMGVVSVASRIGAASSPFVVQMTRINAILPFAVMGSLSFLAAVFCWILPETMGKSTAEVMEDAKKEAEKEHAMVDFRGKEQAA
ncbi:solute carrier family 22 member 3-like isoform X1 [Montipora capricornis]|uniref:solute carrier family 22 member 3-like isoform X1 n=1 Tax=Montipora capricornis TaxID=246305 RepID=UPI0035F21AE9